MTNKKSATAPVQLAFPASGDFCTVAWAAELLGMSQRGVAKLVQDGRLREHMPLVGSRESKRHKRLLSADEVREYKRALLVVRGE